MTAKLIRRLSVPAALAAALAAPPASAQSERVFVTSRDNEVREVLFGAGETAPFATVAGNAFTGLAVVSTQSGDPRVIVASTTQGGAVLLLLGPNGQNTPITDQPFPGGIGGITVDSIGNVLAVNDGGSVSQVWLVPRDPACSLAGPSPGDCYGEPVRIDADVAGAQILADIAVIPYPVAVNGTEFEAGHFVVLVQRPPMLLRYPADCLDAPFPCDEQPVLVTKKFTDEPTSIALAPDGAMLVTAGHRVLRIPPEGGDPDATDFIPVLPGDGAGIAVGRQGDKTRIFVSTRSSGAANRYDFGVTGGKTDFTKADLGSLISVDDDLQSPRELGSAASSAAVPTPASQTGTTILANADQISFEIVDESGQTILEAFVFPDCRELGQCDGTTLSIKEISQGVLPADFDDFDLPPTFKGLSKGGVPTFVVLRGETDAVFRGPIEHHILEEKLGLDPVDCDTVANEDEPRTCYHSDTVTFVEGNQACIDISTDCGSNVGRGWGFSSFVTGRDEQDVAVILDGKLDSLKRAVTCLSRKERRDLDKLLRDAIREARRADYCGVEDALEAFRDPGLTPTADVCQAELDARAESALFMNSKLLPGSCP